MKIRTDFVTNSSSSSFVSYNLKDSEFCKYVFEKMQENGLKYKESLGSSSNYVTFNKDSLYARICTRGYDLNCDRYAPEIYEREYNFSMDINSIENYLLDDEAKVKFRQIIAEELKTTGFNELLEYGDFSGYAQDNYGMAYEEREIYDSDELQLCGRLFKLLSESVCDERHVKKSQNMIHVVSIPDNGYADFIDFFDDYLCACYYDSNGYTEERKNDDIEEMTYEFIRLISKFIPLDKIGDKEKFLELFEQDKENGKLSCDVYMGTTD